MADNREVLRKGQVLVLGEGRHFMIGDVVGRGGSCIVYEAEYRDTLGHSHRVRVKECYPYLLNLSRKENGCLEVTETVKERFDEEKKRFQKAYERNTEIKNTLGLMNSTVNPMNIYDANNTVYTVMECNEALNYAAYMEKHPEESLSLFFTRMKALAQVIDKYHQKGILHLDIKPENMLVIGETAELVLLFDFDSLLTEEELKYGKEVRISFSDGFTAPEQKNGQRNKIGRHTDIYAIGAIVYHRLFGKSPEYNQGTKNATYDYKAMLCSDERYQPVLYRKLDEFFHKTVAVATVLRWKKMQDVISCLDELILLSDLKREVLWDNFTYSSCNFVGRERELKCIKEIFLHNHVVFLSGIGGIGKTELARGYAHLNRGNFRTIVFANFQKNIMETVCSGDFKIANYEEDISFILSERFEQKLGALQKLLSKEDLVILDNFDVEQDDDLEELLEKCPCKFLITTRADYRDYNYPQMEVTEIADKDELLRLFGTYNSNYGNYEDEEKEYVEKIIELVECHTMTVELIAKYLRDSVDTPILLYNKMCQKEGITRADDTLVKNRKDKKLRNESELLPVK